MDPVALGKSAATGWRARVADAVANPVSRVAPMEPDQVRALVGATFFLLSLYTWSRPAAGPSSRCEAEAARAARPATAPPPRHKYRAISADGALTSA